MKKAALYIRESSEEQDTGFSPDNQERTIREYAKKNNIKIVCSFKDLETGTSVKKRSDFLKMMLDAEKKIFDVVLVYHTSRFARNVEEARKYKTRLREKLKIDVISVTQNFGDWRNPSSFLNEGVNELFDAYYSKQLSAWVRGGLMEKRLQGKPAGPPPYGYYKKKLSEGDESNPPVYEGKWRKDKTKAKFIKEAFLLYEKGNSSYSDIAKKLNEAGARTNAGNPFTYGAVKDILKNKTYTGCIYSPRRDYPEVKGEHEPIISEMLFDSVQERIAERKNTQGRPVAQHRFYLLQGLVYCYKCKKHLKKKNDTPQAKMSPKMYCQRVIKGKHERLIYCCKHRREYNSCNQPWVTCSVIDKQMQLFMSGLVLPDNIINATTSKMESLMKAEYGASDTQEQVNKLQSRRTRINKIYRLGEMSDDDYEKDIKEIKEKLKKYAALGVSSKSKEKIITERKKITEKFLKDFKKVWSHLPPEEQRAWIQMCIKRVWVSGKKIVAIEPRDEFLDLFESHQKVIGQPPLATPVWVLKKLKKVLLGLFLYGKI